jgi:hypothetical protein
METIFGFVAGYLAGAQDGPEGLRRLRESLKSIANSAEMRRLAGEAITLGETIVRRVASEGLGGSGGSAGSVTNVLVHRASEALAKRTGIRAA